MKAPRSRLLHHVAALLLGGALALSHVAFAEPTEDEIAKAKERFQEGLGFEESGDWKDALTAFQDVAKVKLTAQVRYKIAFSEEHLGRVLAAVTGYREALDLAQKDPEKAAAVLNEAPKRIESLEPQIPHMTISVVRPTEGASDAKVLLDGKPLDPSQWGKRIEVEVGEHSVEVEIPSTTGAPKREPIESLDVKLADDEKVRVDLNEFLVAPKVDGPKTPEMVERSGTKVPAIIVGTIGLGSLVTSAVFLGLREAAIAEVRASCKDPENDRGCDPKLEPVAADGQTYTYVSASMLAVGVVGLGVGAALWFTVGGKHLEPAPKQSIFIGPGTLRFTTTF